MIKSIRGFSYTAIIFTVLLFVSIFFYYFFLQINNSADLIVHEARKDLSSLSYTISKQIQSKEDVSKIRALLDRTVAANNFIKTILITDTQNVLSTTDYHFKKIPNAHQYYIPESMSSKDIVNQHKILHNTIYYFSGLQKQSLNLFIVLEYKTITEHIDSELQSFSLNIFFVSILYLILISYIISKLIINPLEMLRQYAYYQSTIPKKFTLIELEYIRSSMIQTFQRLEVEKKELYKLARTDSLSGLANREYLSERLGWLISEADRSDAEFALLFLDLDHFKTVNDSLGHNIGDVLLRKIAHIIEDVIRSSDIVARVGGDEFVVILTQYDSTIELTQVIDRIQERVQQPHTVEKYSLEVTSSIGIAFYPKDGRDEITLMKHADIAMYQAKKDGRNQYHFFTKTLHEQIQKEISLDKEMKHALKNSEFELYYQPKTNTYTGEIIACEALIRWNHPEKGMIYPNSFIPLAEKNNFIIELGLWILQEAMKQQVKWKREGICDIPISINISVKQLFHRNFENDFKEIVQKSSIETAKIDIEIVESLFLKNIEDSKYLLNMFHELGVTISLDDFGTGYSSLSYLKEFPIDTLKIDKIFIDDYKSESGAIFLETIIKMGETLKLNVLCEGIETQEQLEFIKTLHCDYYQGYFCSKPISATAFAKLITQQN